MASPFLRPLGTVKQKMLYICAVNHISVELCNKYANVCVDIENAIKLLRNHDDVDVQSDDYSLGLHIVNEHGCTDEGDFNRLYNVQIIENCSPSFLEKT